MNLQHLIGQRLFTAFANWVIRRALRTPYTHLRQADGRPYMDRYWFMRLGKSGDKGQYPWVGARVHHIQSSDDDRAFHDHPWPFITIILRGGYTETRPVPFLSVAEGGGRIHSDAHTGDIRFRRSTDWHMLSLAPGQEAVTFFITFPQAQSWGFLWDGKKVPYREFESNHGSSGMYLSDTPGGVLSGRDAHE